MHNSAHLGLWFLKWVVGLCVVAQLSTDLEPESGAQQDQQHWREGIYLSEWYCEVRKLREADLCAVFRYCWVPTSTLESVCPTHGPNCPTRFYLPTACGFHVLIIQPECYKKPGMHRQIITNLPVHWDRWKAVQYRRLQKGTRQQKMCLPSMCNPLPHAGRLSY